MEPLLRYQALTDCGFLTIPLLQPEDRLRLSGNVPSRRGQGQQVKGRSDWLPPRRSSELSVAVDGDLSQQRLEGWAEVRFIQQNEGIDSKKTCVVRRMPLDTP